MKAELPYLYFRLKLFKGDVQVSKRSTDSKRKIQARLKRVTDFDKAELKVSYGGVRSDLANEGEYTNREDLLNALEVFTEESLILYVRDGITDPQAEADTEE